MNSQVVLLVVTFLAAATLALGASVPNETPAGVPEVTIPDSTNRDGRQVLGQVGQPGQAPVPVDSGNPDDLKADGTFGLWGGWGYGGWGGGWGGYYPYRYGGYYGRRYGWPYYGGGYGGYGGYGYGW